MFSKKIAVAEKEINNLKETNYVTEKSKESLQFQLVKVNHEIDVKISLIKVRLIQRLEDEKRDLIEEKSKSKTDNKIMISEVIITDQMQREIERMKIEKERIQADKNSKIAELESQKVSLLNQIEGFKRTNVINKKAKIA